MRGPLCRLLRETSALQTCGSISETVTMNVLIANHFPLDGSGSGTYTLNLAKELANAGHEVLVLVPEHTTVISYPFPVWTLIFSNGKNTNFDLDFNFPCFTTHPRSNVTFFALTDQQILAYIQAWRQIMRKAVITFHPDIMHINHIWVIPFVASETGIPYVITCHGTDLIGFRRDPRYHEMALTAAEKALAVISLSRQVKTEAKVTYGLSEEKLRLIIGGFDPAIFKVMPQITKTDLLASLGLEVTDNPLIVFAGKLTEFKGVDVLLRAAVIYEQSIGAQTLIVGDGVMRDELQALRDQLGLRKVHFLGHRPQAILARIYNAADICVVPSRNEPFGLVAIEALACGTPVIATNEGGLPDFINQQVGTLVPADDHVKLAQAIINEINHCSKQTKGVCAVQYAQNFSWHSQVTKVISLYEEVLQAGHF